MTVHFKHVQRSFAMVLFLIAMISLGRVSYAQDMSMDAFRTKFQQETGKIWKDATAEEKRNFINKTQEIYQQKPEEIRGQLPEPVERSSGLEREVNVDVRKKFLEKVGKPWEEGTPEEQEYFIKEYKIKKAKEARVEKRKKREEEALERTKQRDKEAALKEKQREKKAEERQERAEKQALEEKKEAERRKLEDTAKKLKEMRREVRQKRKQGKH